MRGRGGRGGRETGRGGERGPRRLAVTPPRQTAQRARPHGGPSSHHEKGTAVALASTPDRPHGEFAMRYVARLNKGVRQRLHARREELFATLATLDDELQTRAEPAPTSDRRARRDPRSAVAPRRLVSRPSPAERRPTARCRPSPPHRSASPVGPCDRPASPCSAATASYASTNSTPSFTSTATSSPATIRSRPSPTPWPTSCARAVCDVPVAASTNWRRAFASVPAATAAARGAASARPAPCPSSPPTSPSIPCSSTIPPAGIPNRSATPLA